MPTAPAFQFAITCDRLQLKIENGKDIWATLMAKSQRVHPSELKSQCDLVEHFEEDEAYEQLEAEDPDTGCYRTDLPTGPVFFIQTSGFEYFFTQDGKVPVYYEKLSEIVHESARNNCEGRLILPANNALANGSFGYESEPVQVGQDIEMIKGTNTRYRLMQDGKAIAGALLQGDQVVTTFALMNNQSAAADLVDRIKNLATKPAPLKKRPQRDAGADHFEP